MSDFNQFLQSTGEIGTVKEKLHSIVYADGLPNLKPEELVIFENGQLGKTLSLSKSQAEILLLSGDKIKVGDKIARTNQFLSIGVSDDILGCVIDPLGTVISGKKFTSSVQKEIDIAPPGLTARKIINE